MQNPGRVSVAIGVLSVFLLIPAAAEAGEKRALAGRVRAEGPAPWHQVDLCDPHALASSAHRGFGPLWLADGRHPGRRARRAPLPWRAKRFAARNCAAHPAEQNLLTDESGRIVAEVGRIQIGSVALRVPLGHVFTDPVVLLGPATAHESDAGALRVSDVGADGFRARFEEWTYLDGVHGPEHVSFLVVERGVHHMTDGSVWEADILEADGDGLWSEAVFAHPFAARPHLFLSVQSRREPDPVVARAHNASTERGFLVALFEEEALGDGHAGERVGYLAASAGGGRLTTETGSAPTLVRRLATDHLAMPVLAWTLWFQEERSTDDEEEHAEETVDFLALGPHVFAQDVSTNDLDTATLRRAGPDPQAGVEWGTVSDLTDAWQTVPFSRSYDAPVVVVRPLSMRGADPAHARVRRVAGDGFQVRAEEWAYLDGGHSARERAFYLVAEEGIQEMGGLLFQAAAYETSTLTSDGFDDVPFLAPFESVPGVFASVMTSNGADPVVVRMAARGPGGVLLAMQEEEALNDGHTNETLGWIAVEQGFGTTADGRTVGVFDTAANHEWTDVAFGDPLGGHFPFVVGQIASYVGGDPVSLHFRDLDPFGVAIRLREEQSKDPDFMHALEDVTLFVGE